MRRYYVSTFDAMHKHKEILGMARTTYLTLPNGLVLMSANPHNEAAEERLFGDPEIAILPDPVFEGNEMLRAHLAKPSRKLKQEHLDALKSIGADERAGVLDLEQLVVQRSPSMRIRTIL